MTNKSTETRTFCISASYKRFIYLAIILNPLFFFLVIYLGFIYPVTRAPTHPVVLILLFISIYLELYLVSTLPKLNGVISLSGGQIILNRTNGPAISIGINEISQLKNNIMMGRLEIYAGNPERVIHIEHQINSFNEFVLQLDKIIEEEPGLNTINLKNLYPYIFWNSFDEEGMKRQLEKDQISVSKTRRYLILLILVIAALAIFFARLRLR
jgi:hypothetical protein